MHRKDSGASGTRDHGDVEAFEAMSDLRGDRFFRLVESGTDSTEHCPQTLIDTTPSKMRDTRPSTAIQSSTTVTNFTADQSDRDPTQHNDPSNDPAKQHATIQRKPR
jgi:hypothetical protein